MLSGIRTAATTWLGKAVLVVLFGFLIVSFAIWGIGDIFRGGPQTTVARVGSIDIRTEEYRREFQNRVVELQRRLPGLTTQQARDLGVDRQVLTQLMGLAAANEGARRIGLALSNEHVARTIAEAPGLRGPDGRLNRAALDNYLREVKLSEAGLIAQQRDTLIRRQMTQALTGGLETPRALLEAMHRYTSEERTIEYLLIPGAIAAAIPLPDEAQLKALHEQRKAGFRAPEYRAFNLLAVLPEDFAGTVAVTDAELQTGYERMLAAGRLGAPERRQVQQIVFPDAAAAGSAAQRIQAGLAFDDLVAEMKLKPEDVDLGLKARGDLVDRAVADAAFALAAGAVSTPVQGQFGAVIVRVARIEPSTAPSLSAIADTVRADVVATKLTSDRSVRDRVNQLHDKVEESRTAGKTLEQAAAELNLTLRKVDAVDAQGRGRDGEPLGLPEAQDLLRAVFASDRGIDNEAIKTRANGYLWFEISNVERSRERAYDEVKDAVADVWRRDEAARRTQEQANELLRKAEGGATLAAIAGEIGGTVETVAGVTREGREAIGRSAAATAFASPVNGFAVAAAAQGADRLLLRATERTVPPFDPAAAGVAQTKRSLDGSLAEDLMGAYVRLIEDQLGSSINERALALATGAQTGP
jgi:peptidyl-prolyl cis-trans isomerase D